MNMNKNVENTKAPLAVELKDVAALVSYEWNLLKDEKRGTPVYKLFKKNDRVSRDDSSDVEEKHDDYFRISIEGKGDYCLKLVRYDVEIEHPTPELCVLDNESENISLTPPERRHVYWMIMRGQNATEKSAGMVAECLKLCTKLQENGVSIMHGQKPVIRVFAVGGDEPAASLEKEVKVEVASVISSLKSDNHACTYDDADFGEVQPESSIKFVPQSGEPTGKTTLRYWVGAEVENGKLVHVDFTGPSYGNF